jgi:hypothetical protein
MTRLRHSKQLISVTMIAHAIEEHVTSAVTSRNNRRAAGSGAATRSGTRRTVPLQWNMEYHATHISRGTMFSVGSAPTLYHSTELSLVSEWSGVSWLLSCYIGDSKREHEAMNTEAQGSTTLEAVTRQPMNTQQTEKN